MSHPLSPEDEADLGKHFDKPETRRSALRMLERMSPEQRRLILRFENENGAWEGKRISRLRTMWRWACHIGPIDFHGAESDPEQMAAFWNLDEVPRMLGRGGWSRVTRKEAMRHLRDYYAHQYAKAGHADAVAKADAAVVVPGIEDARQAKHHEGGAPVRHAHVRAADAVLGDWIKETEDAPIESLQKQLYGLLHTRSGERGTYVDEVRWRDVEPARGPPRKLRCIGKGGKDRGVLRLDPEQAALLSAIRDATPFAGRDDLVLFDPAAASTGSMEPWTDWQIRQFWITLRRNARIPKDTFWCRRGIRRYQRTRDVIKGNDIHLSRQEARHRQGSDMIMRHYLNPFDREEAATASQCAIGPRGLQVCEGCGLPLLPSERACPFMYCGRPTPATRAHPIAVQLDAFGLMDAMNQGHTP